MTQAVAQFDEYGYHATSLQSIADAVGIRKASLYYYFANKDEILLELHDRLIDEVTAKHAQRLDAGGLTSTQLIGAMMRDVITLMETRPGHLRVFFESYRGLSVDTHDRVSGARSAYRRAIRDVIEAGVASGEFDVDDPHLASLAVLSLMNWTYQWFDTDGDLSATQVADGYLQLLLEGMRPHTAG